MASDLGDFQTPPGLVAAVLECLGPIGKVWSRVLEPTCGRGNFIAGLLHLPTPPTEIQAFELQDAHVHDARRVAERCPSVRVTIRKANLFDLDLGHDLQWRETGPLLVVGNPPWITNSGLSALGSNNRPPKKNLKGLRGIEALTGESNFDIAEYIWLKLIRELAFEQPTIALLCKTSVARNVLQFASLAALPITHASICRIDARRWFGVAADACLFRVEVGLDVRRYEAAVYPDLRGIQPESVVGVANGRLIADLAGYKASSFADGMCPLTWRQGIKHDAASVMELTPCAEGFRNKFGELIRAERDYVYPLLKGSDLFRQVHVKPVRSVIVTQRRIGEDTRGLQQAAPRLWDYLVAYADVFGRRKSSIYRGQPRFAMFGIGDYSFALYKVGIAGLYKIPKFRSIGHMDGRPIMLDDTCYFIACYCAEQAALLASLLNDPACLSLIHSMVFWDSKRPVTKKLLQRIDLRALLKRVDRCSLLARADAQLEHIRTSSSGQRTMWPSALEELLVECPSNASISDLRSLTSLRHVAGAGTPVQVALPGMEDWQYPDTALRRSQDTSEGRRREGDI